MHLTEENWSEQQHMYVSVLLTPMGALESSSDVVGGQDEQECIHYQLVARHPLRQCSKTNFSRSLSSFQRKTVLE